MQQLGNATDFGDDVVAREEGSMQLVHHLQLVELLAAGYVQPRRFNYKLLVTLYFRQSGGVNDFGDLTERVKENQMQIQINHMLKLVHLIVQEC